ncbi:hypothetical protein AB0878_46590 [Amycolatopsis sp. NPDC047767]|uniref:hypothetical protein n=1 Tax=Amycolatopsis sp. NPDC047767 TaxID=3156765 RepID=UPI003454C814
MDAGVDGEFGPVGGGGDGHEPRADFDNALGAPEERELAEAVVYDVLDAGVFVDVLPDILDYAPDLPPEASVVVAIVGSAACCTAR